MAREILMFVFPTRGKLVDATDTVRTAGNLKIHNTALIAKAEDGETAVFDDDLSPVEGAVSGGTLGGMMGALGIAGLGAILLPGVGAVLAIGAGALLGGVLGGVTGGAVARALDFGVNDQALRDLAATMETDHVALVMDVEGDPSAISALESSLLTYDARLVRRTPQTAT